MTTGRSTLLFFIVASFCVYLAVGQTNTGLVIDGARIASSFFIRDEYYAPDDCLVKVFQFTTGFRKVARFDLALANLGSQDFFTTRAHPPSLCGGLNRYNNLLSIDVLDSAGNPTLYISQPKGICLEDTEVASGTPSGTPATKANYTCVSTTNGISVGWQTVIPAENDMTTVDLTPIYTDGTPGQFYHLVIKIRMSLLGNYTDVQYTHGFYMPFDNNCYPSPPYTVTTGASQWIDPSTHDLTGPWTDQTETPPTVQVLPVSLGTFGFVDTPFCLGADPTQGFIRDNGIMAFDSNSIPSNGPGVRDNYDNTIPDFTGTPYYLGRTVFPFWDSYGYINSTETKIYTYNPDGNNFYVTWTGINRLFATEYFPVSVQVHAKSNGDFVFSYNKLPNGDTNYKNGKNATVGICAGAVKDPGNGNFSANNYFFQSNVDNNCVIYSLNSAKLSTSTSIIFTKNTATTRTLPTEPVANVTGPLSGQINSSYEYSAEFSQTFGTASKVRYQWIWGDGSIPSYGAKVNHTWISVGVYSIRMRVFDGIQFSSEANYTIYMGPIILNNETATGGDGSDNTGGYIAIAVVLPILFVIVLIILLAIFLFVFFRRHVLPSGGAWWEEDPIYLNLEEQQ